MIKSSSVRKRPASCHFRASFEFEGLFALIRDFLISHSDREPLEGSPAFWNTDGRLFSY